MGQQVGDEEGGRQHLLEVIQHEQCRLVSTPGEEAVAGRRRRWVRHAELGRDAGGDGLGSRHCGQLDPPDAIGEGITAACRDLKRHTRLAHAAAPEQRDEGDVRLAQQHAQLVHQRLAPNQGGALARQQRAGRGAALTGGARRLARD